MNIHQAKSIVLNSLTNPVMYDVIMNSDWKLLSPDLAMCLEDIKEAKITPSIADLDALASARMMEQIPPPSSVKFNHVQATQALQMIRDIQIGGNVTQLAMSPTPQAFGKIESLLRERELHIPEARFKRWEKLSEREDDVMFKFLDYNISRGKVTLLTSFAGIGKTTTSLAFANIASCSGYNVLFIALADWSEAELKRRASVLADRDRCRFAVYDDLMPSLIDIDFEIGECRPDVVIIDALTDIRTSMAEEKLHKRLGELAARIRLIAVQRDCHIFATHQAVVLEKVMRPEHIRDSKSDILQPVDLCLGLGAGQVSDLDKVISTLKVRHQQAQNPRIVAFNYEHAEIIEKGEYDTSASYKWGGESHKEFFTS